MLTQISRNSVAPLLALKNTLKLDQFHENQGYFGDQFHGGQGYFGDQIHGGQGLLWGFYTFCEPSVRPHFIASTKQAQRTGDNVQSSSVKFGHFRRNGQGMEGSPVIFETNFRQQTDRQLDRGL